MAAPKQKEVLILVDDYSTGEHLKCCDIVKLDPDVADDLVKRGIADDNPKAIAPKRKQQQEKPAEDEAIEE